MSLLLAASTASLISGLGWTAGALGGGGLLAAILVGTGILRYAGWPGAAVLGVFFVGASGVSRWLEPAVSPGNRQRRNARQVLANGGAAAMGAWLAGTETQLALMVSAAALAAAAADTWATAVGSRSPSPPRDLLRGTTVVLGTSGGVTLQGLWGSVLGAASVAATLAMLGQRSGTVLTIWGIGVVGALLDSLLGSGLQAKYHCAGCQETGDHPVHRCGAPAARSGGVAWVTNDVVNLVATSIAALFGWCVWRWLA